MALDSPTRLMPAPTFNPRSHDSLLKWFLVTVAAIAALLIASLLLLLFGDESGFAGLLVGILCATLPVPIYATFLLWIDRFEPEPPWILATAFLWGALVAALVAYIVNSLVKEIVGVEVSMVVSAPFVEESMKASILVIIFFWRKADFDGMVDGIVYSGMVALGFAMTENIAYYSREFKPDGHLGTLFVLRGVMSPFAHPLFTSMTGLGLGIARESKNTLVQMAAPLLGFMLAILLHFIWNAGPTLGGGMGTLLMYFVFMVPVFFGVLGIVIFALVREGRMVRRNLAPEVHSGLLKPTELHSLSSMFGRASALVGALSNAGLAGWRSRRRFHEAATHLAFHRHRVACGTIDCDDAAVQRESDLQARLFQASLSSKS